LTKLDQIRAAEERLLLSTYDRNPILFVGGEGVHIIDENGTKYLDLLSGIGVNALGYASPVIEGAIAEQSRKLIHTSNLYYHEGQAELALRLTERTELSRPHLRRRFHHCQGEVSRALRPGSARRGVCELQRRGRPARQVLQRSLRHSA
jgi:acetylornithine/succinyldiaminopimelate/putrescine aminotransferase